MGRIGSGQRSGACVRPGSFMPSAAPQQETPRRPWPTPRTSCCQRSPGPSGSLHNRIQVATPRPSPLAVPQPTASSAVPGPALGRAPLPPGRPARVPQLWPPGAVCTLLTRLPRVRTGPARRLCVATGSTRGPELLPLGASSPSGDLAWVSDNIPRGSALCHWGVVIGSSSGCQPIGRGTQGWDSRPSAVPREASGDQPRDTRLSLQPAGRGREHPWIPLPRLRYWFRPPQEAHPDVGTGPGAQVEVRWAPGHPGGLGPLLTCPMSKVRSLATQPGRTSGRRHSGRPAGSQAAWRLCRAARCPPAGGPPASALGEG